MATTVKHQPPSNRYVLVINGTSNDFLLSNVGREKTNVMIAWASSEPAASLPGHVLRPGEAVIRNGLTGQVWARGMTKDCVVAATEE